MKTSFLMATLLVTMTGCSFAARSPEMYRDDTKAVLATKNEEIRACYNGVLKDDPNAGGKVTLKFDVETEEGKIVNVEVDEANTTAPESVSACVAKSVDGLGLTPPDARKGEASWTWELSPEG